MAGSTSLGEQQMDTLSFLQHICSKLDRMHEEVNIIKQQHDESNKILNSQLQELKNCFEKASKTTVNGSYSLANLNTGHDSSSDGISGTEEVHRECLQENLETISKDIVLRRVLVLDESIEEGIMTENEAANVREFKDNQDQTRKLVAIMGKRSAAKFVRFLEILMRSHNYPYVAKQLVESYKSKIERRRLKKKCIPCFIKGNVNIKDIVDKLCASGVVNLDFLDLAVSSDLTDDRTKESLWRRLFESVDFSDDQQQNRLFLKEALKSKYDHIAKKLSSDRDLRCHCKDYRVEFDKAKMSYPSCGSTDEISPISVRQRRRSIQSTISEGGSDFSFETADVHPRTIDWVVDQINNDTLTTDTIPVPLEMPDHTWSSRSTDLCKDQHDTLVSSAYAEAETTKPSNMKMQPTIKEKKSRIRTPETYSCAPDKGSAKTFLAIGSDILLTAGTNESKKYEQAPRNLALRYHEEIKSDTTEASYLPVKYGGNNIPLSTKYKTGKTRRRKFKSKNDYRQRVVETNGHGYTENKDDSDPANEHYESDMRRCPQTNCKRRLFQSIQPKTECIKQEYGSTDISSEESKKSGPHSKMGCRRIVIDNHEKMYKGKENVPTEHSSIGSACSQTWY